MRTKAIIDFVLFLGMTAAFWPSMVRGESLQQAPNVAIVSTGTGTDAAELTHLMERAAHVVLASYRGWRSVTPERVAGALAQAPVVLGTQDAVAVGRALQVPMVLLFTGALEEVNGGQWRLRVRLHQLEVASGQEWRRVGLQRNLPGRPSPADPRLAELVEQMVTEALQSLDRYQQTQAPFMAQTGDRTVTLAIGTQQGVRPGAELSLFQQGELQARVRVEKAGRHESQAALTWVKPGAVLVVGDVFELTADSESPPKAAPSKRRSSSYRALTTLLAVVAAAFLVSEVVGGDDDDKGRDRLPTPQGLILSAGDRSVTLAWQPLKVGNVAGYVIYRSDYSDRGFAPVSEVNARTTSFVDTGLTNGKPLYYQIAAIDQQGNEGERTVARQVIPEAGTGQPSQLPAPEGLITSASDQTVVIAWRPLTASDLRGYVIYRSEFPDLGFAPVGEVDERTTSYKDVGLPNGKTFYYQVVAKSLAGIEGERSEIISATPTTDPPPTPGGGGEARPPVPPQNLQVRAEFDRNTVTWEPNPETDIKEYRVYRVQSDTISPQTVLDQIATVPVPMTSFVDSGVTTGLKYYYRIKAVNEEGLVSPYSLPAFGRPGQPFVQLYTLQDGQEVVALPPALDSTDPKSTTVFNLGWSAVANAERYIVEISLDPSFTTLIYNGNPVVEAGPSPTLEMTLQRTYNVFGTTPVVVPVQHYWRVTAVDDQNVSIDQSEVRGFVVLYPDRV